MMTLAAQERESGLEGKYGSYRYPAEILVEKTGSFKSIQVYLRGKYLSYIHSKPVVLRFQKPQWRHLCLGHFLNVSKSRLCFRLGCCRSAE